MTSSGDRYARDASGFSSSGANVTQSHTRQALQPQRQTTAPQVVMLQQHLPQNQHSGTAYYPHQDRSYQQTASSQGTLGYTYAPSNQPAYQGRYVRVISLERQRTLADPFRIVVLPRDPTILVVINTR